MRKAGKLQKQQIRTEQKTLKQNKLKQKPQNNRKE